MRSGRRELAPSGLPLGAGREHDRRGLGRGQIGHAGLAAHAQRAARALERRDEILDRAVPAIARRQPRELAHVAARQRVALVHDHLVPARGGGRGRAQARRARADHDHPAGLHGRAQRAVAERRLTARGGREHARDLLRAQRAPDAHVGTDAARRHGEAVLARLADQMRVGEVRAGHADDVGSAIGNRARCHAEIDDAARHEDGGTIADHALGLGRGGDRVALGDRHRRDRQIARVAGADREVVEVVDAGGREQLELREGVGERDAVRAEPLVIGQREADREVVAHLGTHRAADLEREPAAILEAPAVLVVAVVVEDAQELRDQPAVRAVHLDAVQTGRLEVARGARVVGDDLGDLVTAERERALAAGPRDVRGPARRRPVVERAGARGVRAAGDELPEEARRIRLEPLAHVRQGLDLPLVVGRDGGREVRLRERRRRQLLGEHEPHAAACALAVEVQMALADEPRDAVLQRRRGGHHAIRERRPPQLQRLPERLEAVSHSRRPRPRVRPVRPPATTTSAPCATRGRRPAAARGRSRSRRSG